MPGMSRRFSFFPYFHMTLNISLLPVGPCSLLVGSALAVHLLFLGLDLMALTCCFLLFTC